MIDEQKYRAVIQQLATGGITGNKTYHQYHDQYVPMDSESMMYANGGGVGSMMQPRQNYALAGFIEDESETFTPNNFGLQINNDNVDNNELAFTPDSTLDKQINKLNTLEKMGYSQPNLKNLKEMDMKQFKEKGIPLSLGKDEYVSNDEFLANNDLYADSGMFANDATWGGNDSGVIYQGDINKAPVINDFNRGPITYDQNTGRVPPGYKDGIMNMAPSKGRFSEFDQARMGAPANTSLGYKDRIMNMAENYTPNYDSVDDSFEEIAGYNFIDAPNSFSSRLKNPQFLNNPRRGIIDNQLLGKGSDGEFGAINKVKDFFGNTKDKIGNVGKRFKEGTAKVFSPLTALASIRDPLNPKSQNYNSNLASQLNFADGMGMITDGNKFSEKMMLNGEVITNPLRGQNAISGYGSNDLIAQLEKTLGKQTKTYNKLSDIKKLNYKNKFLNNTQTLLDQAVASQTKERNDRIAAEKNAARAANTASQRRAGKGGSHMSRSVGQGGLGISRSQAQSVSDANRSAGYGGWGLARGGIVSLKR